MSLKHIFPLRIVTFALCIAVGWVMTDTVFAQQCPGGQVFCDGQCQPEGSLCLLEPPPGAPSVITPGQNAWQLYVNNGLWQWALMIGVALAVLNATVAGFQMMTDAQRGPGKERLIWSIVGLILLLFAGVILNFINPNAFSPF